MSIAAAQAAIFYRDVARTRRLWTIRDAGGFPAPKNSRGVRAQPIVNAVHPWHNFMGTWHLYAVADA